MAMVVLWPTVVTDMLSSENCAGRKSHQRLFEICRFSSSHSFSIDETQTFVNMAIESPDCPFSNAVSTTF